MTLSEIRRGRWSAGELARLEELYGLRSDGAIARVMGRPVSSVRKMAEEVFRGPIRSGPWSADETLALKRYLGASPAERIAQILRRNVNDVQRKIATLGRRRVSGPWGQDEIAQFKQLYGSRSDADLARILARSEESIRRQAALLRLSKDKLFLSQMQAEPTRMPRWSAKELKTLRVLYRECSNLEIAKILKRSVKSVVSKAHDLRLKKDTSRLEEMGRQNVSLRADR